MTRPILTTAILTMVLGFGSFFAANKLRSQAFVSTARAPYTMLVQERHFPSGAGPGQTTREYIFAVRGDGSTVQVEFSRDDTGAPIVASRTIRNMTERKRSFIDERTRLMTTQFFSPSAMAAAAQAHSDLTCMSTGYNLVYLGTGQFLDRKIIKLQNNGSKTTTIEHWAAPDLGCEYLLSKWYIKNPDGSLQETVEQAAVSLVAGEPAAELFSMRPDLKESTPSAVIFESLGKSKDKFSNDAKVKERLDKMDQAYHTSRQFAP